MNAFGIAIVWCALQVSIVTLIAIAADLAMKRRGRTGGSMILLAGLTGAILLTLLIWSPWPRWSWKPSMTAGDAAGNKAVTVSTDEVVPAARPSTDVPNEVGEAADWSLS